MTLDFRCHLPVPDDERCGSPHSFFLGQSCPQQRRSSAAGLMLLLSSAAASLADLRGAQRAMCVRRGQVELEFIVARYLRCLPCH
jgi:hypothetical protein